MRHRFLWVFAGSAALVLAGCHSSTAGGDIVTNTVADNTVGTASDAMTNVDATTGSAINMAADVGDTAASNKVSADDSSDSSDAGDNSSK